MVLSSEILNPLTIRQQLHLSQERMSHLLGISSKTLWRWENTDASPSNKAKPHLAKLKQIASLAEKVYTPEGIAEFMSTPLEEFGGHTAYDIMSLGEYDRVIAALATDYEGLGY
ncbi:MAG: helix-turn-helix transcriptional regulator [Xenococcaceae cyanobacterium MO_234.B1]|nr:helix-turn-helix transcriptional regulator [Xenococcaceae cyanobacterium MO_234.B1]